MIFETRCAGCDVPGAAVCTTCRFALLGPRPRLGAHGVRSAVAFTGRARRVVLGVKYRNRRQASRHLAGLLVASIVANGDHTDLDLVTWAPTSAEHRRSRGFDQAALVAAHVARQLGVPCRRVLERDGDSPAQTGRSRVERLAGPRFSARPGLDGRRIMVIDDVVTTGATLHAARRALLSRGVSEVVLYAVASTPMGAALAGRPRDRRHGEPVGSGVAA